MKLVSLTVPILILSLTIIAVWGLGVLAVKASAISTQASIDLLRIHLRVAELHDRLAEHTRQSVATDLGRVTSNAPPAPTPDPNAAEPWPEETAEPPTIPQSVSSALPETMPTLEEGLKRARPSLTRLRGKLDRALPH
jgi:hypothetical protein